MPENIFLDGQGSFNHNTKNAGTIKWGEFNNAAVNTGSIVLSAVFTGSSVNSGTIGDLMPVYTVSVFQANSGKWESTYSTVAANSSTWGQGGGGSSDWDSITNKPTEFTPSTHSHTVSEIGGLEPVVTWVSQNSSASEGADAYALIVSNSATWEASDWDSITNKPTEFNPTSHFHHASSINAGVLDPARIPVINTSIQVISQGGLADLTTEQQDQITEGALVTTTDGYRYVYVGGSKVSSGSYIALADITPDWTVISNKPLEFNPSSHTHTVGDINGLQPVMTWVTENSASNNQLGNEAYTIITANSATWETIPDVSLGNEAYTIITANSSLWEAGGNGGSSDWDSITNKPTEFTPSSHFHHASSINAGVLDPARIPVINTSIQVISQGGLADLTQEQQDSVVQGAIVTTTDGQRYVYVGGTKTIVGSYIALADITPDWNVISNKPSLFAPSSHTHTVSEVEGLQPVVTWVSQNSANNVDVTLGNSAYTLIANNSATWAAGGDWSNITNKPTEFTPSSHFHHASSINAGVLDPARIPVINTSIQVISQGGLVDLTQAQQDTIVQGAIVTTTDGQRYVYVSGSKVSAGSYIALADVTPDWSVIANKPTAFVPATHTHNVSEVTGLEPVVTWVSQNSAATPSIINYLFDNGTTKISLNSRGTITMPTNFSITEWKIVADAPTTTVVTLNKASFESFPTMSQFGSVSVVNSRKNLNTSPGFQNLSADDILEFIVSANSDATKLTISLKGYKI